MNSSNPKDRAVFRPTGFADLADKRVGIFGLGVEGRSAAARLEGTCELVLVDDRGGLGGGVLTTTEGGFEALLRCDVVLKTPGIPRRRPDVLNLDAHGVIVTSALNLWLQEIDRRRVVAITGTKGKSTTTALVTFFLASLGEPAQRLGNIGQPPYDPSIDTSSGWLVLEVSSFQSVDLEVAPSVVVITSLGADHLDWHGSPEQYRADKLSMTRAPGQHVTLVPENETFRSIASELGGELQFIAPDEHHLSASLGLLGGHNSSNVALALAATAALTEHSVNDVRAAVLPRAHEFEPLRSRLTLVATETHDDMTWRYVDDGLATAVLPTMAALEVFAHEPVALIAGGFDRGVDYRDLATALAQRDQPTTLFTLGGAGERLAVALELLENTVVTVGVASMREAVELARASLPRGGVVLLSPAAPSFDQYQNWEERSGDFVAAVYGLVPH
jgi:UDP-N-acetylmuramoylalanine--D-glutamate ligase